MSGNVIDGKAVAAKIRSELADQVAALKRDYKRVPFQCYDVYIT